MGGLFPGFVVAVDRGGQRIPFVLAVSPVTLIQNNQYARGAHFGVACPWPQPITDACRTCRVLWSLMRFFRAASALDTPSLYHQMTPGLRGALGAVRSSHLHWPCSHHCSHMGGVCHTCPYARLLSGSWFRSHPRGPGGGGGGQANSHTSPHFPPSSRQACPNPGYWIKSLR